MMLLFRNPSVDKIIFLDENPVFLGYGIDDPEIAWSDYDDVDARGKVVFLYGVSALVFVHKGLYVPCLSQSTR